MPPLLGFNIKFLNHHQFSIWKTGGCNFIFREGQELVSNVTGLQTGLWRGQVSGAHCHTGPREGTFPTQKKPPGSGGRGIPPRKSIIFKAIALSEVLPPMWPPLGLEVDHGLALRAQKMGPLSVPCLIGYWTALVLHITLRELGNPSLFGGVIIGVCYIIVSLVDFLKQGPYVARGGLRLTFEIFPPQCPE